MNVSLSTILFGVGIGQLSVLVASALVPVHLKWKETLADLPPLVRQLFWIYGGYVVLSIISLGLICIVNARELAEGSLLAKSYCAYGAAFWGIRLSFQPFLNAEPHLSAWWLRCGYHVLTILFCTFTIVFTYATVR